MASRILHSFKALDLCGKNLANYRVKFVEPKHYDEALSLMKRFFFPYEPMCRAIGLSKNEQAVEKNLKFWRRVLDEDKVSVGCFKADGEVEKMIGVNFMNVKKKGAKEDHGSEDENPPELNPIYDTLAIVEQSFDVFKHFNVDQYLYGFTVTVDDAYRGRGIAAEIRKARIEVLKLLDLKVTSLTATGIASQKAAKNAGFEENFMISYEEIRRRNGKLYFPGLENECLKIMSMKI